uniref:Uncharacterized protein n=1 Tax=Arundo donax TaxID=35708 RepID=A0A0A9CR76_ARUDO
MSTSGSSALWPMTAAEPTAERSSGRVSASFLRRTMPSCAASTARFLWSAVHTSSAPRPPYGALPRGSPSK